MFPHFITTTRYAVVVALQRTRRYFAQLVRRFNTPAYCRAALMTGIAY